MDRGNWEQAITELNKAIQADPNLELAHRDLGISYYNLDDYQNTIIHLEKYLELVPDDPERTTFEGAIADLKRLLDQGANSNEGLLVITNYVGGRATVAIAGQTYEIPGTDEIPEGGEITVTLTPGHYTATVEGFTQKGERFFGDIEFEIAVGEVLEWPLYFNQ